MDVDFWQQKWQANEIGFHEAAANPLLIENFKHLSLAEGSRIFIPLCGKTLDIAWLLERGMRVVGIELVEMAIEQLFSELELEPKKSTVGKLRLYSANHIDIYVGDIFDLSAAELGSIDAIYDRAALVALPTDMRTRYARHMLNITALAPQLLITFEYDQSLMPGPPFSVSNDEVGLHYRNSYQITLLESKEIAGGLKGLAGVDENVWLLNKM